MGMEQKMMIALVVAHHSLIFGKGPFIKDIETIFAQELETVKESRKIWNFHFDLHLVPTVLNNTLLCCQETGIIS